MGRSWTLFLGSSAHSQSLFGEALTRLCAFLSLHPFISYWHFFFFHTVACFSCLPESQECVFDLRPLGGRSSLHASALAQLSPIHKPFQMEQALKDFWHFFFFLNLFQRKKPMETTGQELPSHSEVTAGVQKHGNPANHYPIRSGLTLGF